MSKINLEKFILDTIKLINEPKYSVALQEALERQGLEYNEETGTIEEIRPKPKFKKGDYIIRSTEGFKHDTYLVIDVKDYYGCEELKEGRRVTFTFNDVHDNFRLWTIQDAKDGDILYCGNIEYDIDFIVIYKHPIVNGCINSYCRYNSEDGFSIDIPRVMRVNDNPQPATQFQKETLFKAMAEAGYIWDAEKKELCKIEPSSLSHSEVSEKNDQVTWSEEDEMRFERLSSYLSCRDNVDSEYIYWLKSIKSRLKGE